MPDEPIEQPTDLPFVLVDGAPFVSIAGLLVPISLAPRLVAAFRSEYPDLTANKTDNQAVPAVIKYWSIETLRASESKQALAGMEPAVAQVQSDYIGQAAAAAVQAKADGDSIIEP